MQMLDGLDPLLRAAAAGLVAAALLLALVFASSRRSASRLSGPFLRRVWAPLLLLGPVFTVRLALPLATGIDPETLEFLRHVLVLLLIATVAWAIISLSSFLDVYMAERFPVDVTDNLLARRMHTRFQVLRRLLIVGTVVVCGAAALMTFPGMRTLGTGLLASAGILGIVLGVAARPTVEALIAGIQLAWTQPIRLDDVVIIEGEWGRIEEIEATYVVVRLWDLRRLIVPLQHLLTNPFQNWTRSSADLLGAVTVEVDYRTPVEAVRRQVGEILAASSSFDGGFWNLQVVEAGPQTMRLRVLVSAPNADEAWALRCEVREKLIAFLQEQLPDCLPRLRAEIAGGPEAPRVSAP